LSGPRNKHKTPDRFTAVIRQPVLSSAGMGYQSYLFIPDPLERACILGLIRSC